MAQSTAQHAARPQALALNGGDPVFKTPVPFMSLALTPEDKAAAMGVLDSGMLRQGPKCAELEKRFSMATGAKHAHTCANGTCALQLAYEPLLQPGDEVLVCAWTYIATASMIVARGCKPVWADCLPDTYQIDVADAEKRITPKTRAIAATHVYGMPVDIDAVEALAKKHNLKIIYDAAQAHLATYKGKGLGEFGDAVTYSFYATKNLGTGEGGMITTNDDDLSFKIQRLRSHGESDTKYLHESIGYNYRMNDITAAIGCSRMDRLGEQTDRRREIAARYNERIADVQGVATPATTPGAEPVWHLYTLRLEEGAMSCDRDAFCAALKAEGVPTAVHYPLSLTEQPAFKGFVTDHPPVARSIAKGVFSLPIHHDLSDEQVDKIADAVAKVAGAYRA